MYDMEQYYQATSVADAIAALGADPAAMPIAGGTDVLIQTREGRHAGCRLVSLHGLPELREIRMEEDGTLVIGSGCTFSEITASPLLQSRAGLLCRAVDQVGSPQIRNMGTLGGNVCNGVTSADSAPSLLVLNAALELQGPEGVRRVPIGQWYTGPGRTVRAHEEVLTAVRIARENYEGFSGCYLKYGKREAMEISTLGCAVLVKLTADRRAVEELRVAFGVAGPTPVRCPATEALAAGRVLDEALVREIGHSVLTEIHPRDSWRASRAFRLQIAKELSRRAFRQAVQDAGGEIHA